MIVFYNGAYMREEEVCFSPNDRGLLFADGVYEVVHTYHGSLFRLEEHLSRLRRSLDALRIRFNDIPAVGEACRELVARNEFTSSEALLYIQITRGAYPRSHAFPPESVKPTLYIAPERFTPRRAEAEAGVAAVLSSDTRWSRCDIKSLSLLPNVLALQDAVEAGAWEALFVRDGMVIEGTRSNLAGILGGRLATPPESNYMLSGITRLVVLELCAELGIPVEERPIPEAEVFSFDELLLMGTGSEILPVTAVNGRSIGQGSVGPMVRRLQRALRTKTAG